MTDVNDRPAERSLNITNILLTILILLGGLASSMITLSIDSVQTEVVNVKDSVDNLNISKGQTEVKFEHLNKDVDAVKARISILEKRGWK